MFRAKTKKTVSLYLSNIINPLVSTTHVIYKVTINYIRSAQNLDIYILMKQKLSKKGLLRKLIDNLVSHRTKIYDSLNHNYQIVLQNSHIENKYAGLLIIDQIIQGIYQSLKVSQRSFDVEGSDDYSNFSTKQRTDNFKQSLQIMFGDSKSKHNKKFKMAIQANPIIRQIDSRFDLIYFSLIIYLLDNVPKMYMRILKSINSYCLNKRSKFLCTQSVWQVIHFIMSKIIKFSSMKQNVFTYMLLLRNVKENFKQYQKAQDLKLFIDLWIREIVTTKHFNVIYQSQAHKNNNNQQQNNNSKNNINYLNEQSQTNQSKSSQQYMGNLIKIISIYFDTNISTWNSNFLYDVTLDIYDEHQFDNEKVLQFQSTIFNIVTKNQLHMQFFRGLFLLLLDYLGYKHAQRGSRVQSMVSLHGEVNEIKWVNCEKKHVKYNALKTLRRWVVNKHIDLNQTVAYNCRLLFQAYLSNYSLIDLQYNTQISKQFLKLIRENLQIKSKKIVIITIIESIKEDDTESRIRSVCIGLLRQLLGDGGILNGKNGATNSRLVDDDVMGDISAMDVIVSIEEYYSKDNKLQLIQLMGFVLHSLPTQYFAHQSFLNDNSPTTNPSINVTFMHKLGQFLQSCYSTIIENQDDLVFKLRFVCSVISLMREICLIKQNISIVCVFFKELMKQLTFNSKIGIDNNRLPQQQIKLTGTLAPANHQSINKLKQYFLFHLTYEIAHLLLQTVNVPQEFGKINQKITKSQTITQGLMGTNKSIHFEKREQVLKMIQKLLSQPRFTDIIIIKQSIKQQQIFQFNKPHLQKQNYKQTQKIISSYFSNYCQRRSPKKNTYTNQLDGNINNQDFMNTSLSGNLANKTGISTNMFGKRDSVYMQSENSSFYREQDKNLKDVLGIINF